MIFITGGTGFLGAHVLVKLVQGDKPIVAAKRLSSSLDYVQRVFAKNNVSQLFHKISWKDIDLYDYFEVEDTIEEATEIYHIAAEVSFHPSKHEMMIKNNVLATKNLVDAAVYHNKARFLFVSSTAALGRSNQSEEIDETRIWKNDPVNSKYAESKYLSEMEVWRGYEEGLKVTIVSPSVILGYTDWNAGTGKLFSESYKGMKYFTEGVNAFVDVNDVAECISRLMKSENTVGQKYLVFSENHTYHQVFDWICESLSKPKPKRLLSPSMIYWGKKILPIANKLLGEKMMVTKESLTNATLVCYYHNDKVKKELNFEFKPVKQTIEETAKEFLAEH